MVIYYRHWQICWCCDRWIVLLMGNRKITSFWIDAISNRFGFWRRRADRRIVFGFVYFGFLDNSKLLLHPIHW